MTIPANNRHNDGDLQAARAVPTLETWEKLGLPPVPKAGGVVSCPWREDAHPSLQVGGGKEIVFDHATKESLDGLALVQKVRGCSFPDAVAFVLGRSCAAPTTAPVKATATAPKADPKPAAPKKYWPDAETAWTAFEKLPLAKDHPGAVELLGRDYGIPQESISKDWRVLSLNGKPGIVYAGRGAEGADPIAYKWKSLERGPDGKRQQCFLFGGGEAGLLVFPAVPSRVIVLTEGEEKANAAAVAGFAGWSGLSGAKAPSAALCAFLCRHAERVILAFDADEAGEKAADATAKALLEAGFPADRLFRIQWPEGAARGLDLNDVLKDSGPDGLKDFFNSARPVADPLPRVMSAADFVATARPPLLWHIKDILPFGGKMTFSATSKWGKSMLAIELGLCLSAGNCEFLGWQFGDPARVLYLQAEIMDGLVCDRLTAILRDMPPHIDRQRAGANFLIQEIADRRPNLLTEAGRACAEALIERHKPQVLILDPLAAICPGLKENETESMSLILDYFSELGRRYSCAVILVHHFGKSGVSRGSSTYEAWPESDLQASFADDSREVAKIEMRLRCAYNSGPAYWKMPSQENLWFENLPDYEPQKSGRASKVKAVHILTALKAAPEPGLSHARLVEAVADLSGASERTAKRALKDAREAGVVAVGNGFYYLPQGGDKT